LTNNQKHINRYLIKRGWLVAISLLFMLLGACGTDSESVSPTPTQVAPIATALPTATPVATMPPEPPPEPTPMPSPTLEPTQTASFVGQAVCTANEYVNIRKSADTDSAVVGTLPAGETADVIAYEDDWANVSYGGVTGFVSRDYLIPRHSPDIEVPAGDWAEVLVNPTHLLPDGFEVELADFEGGQVDVRIRDICEAMFADAKADGVDLKLVDAYRSYETQNEQYHKKVDSYIAKGYSREDAETKAATITARPNTSEHQTGLALDIVTPSYTKRDKGFAKTDAFKWLNVNAQDYGFTMRYKADKQEYTKVIYEPWHWRFVGTEAAKAMKQSGECFEEYLNIID
jgi:D-alanyl-D-alanine carboxypeptidase